MTYIVPWLANLNIKRSVTLMFVNKKYRYKRASFFRSYNCLPVEANNSIVESYNSFLSVEAEQKLATTNVPDSKCKSSSPVETTEIVNHNCLSAIQGKGKLLSMVLIVVA